MKLFSSFFLVFLIFLLASGCENKKISDPADYLKWINNPDNGLTITKYISGIKLTAKFLPPEYLAYRELQSGKLKLTQNQKDSTINFYRNSKSFLLTIGPDLRNPEQNNILGNDIMFRGLKKYEEYKDRNLTMNFDMADYLTLEYGEKKLEPVLTNMENVYGLNADRNIYIVFVEKEKTNNPDNSDTFDLVFNDEIFETGISHFEFLTNKIKEVPSFIF